MTQQAIYRQPAKLVWKLSYLTETAHTVFGTYYGVRHIGGRDAWEAYYSTSTCVETYGSTNSTIGEYASKEIAKAACQADYDRRYALASVEVGFTQ
ncbi:hypothetical protein [Bartonella sp. LJL80]